MSEQWRIEAPMLPRAKARPRAVSIGGHARVYPDRKTVRWEQALAVYASQVLPSEPLDGSLRVDILAVFPRPKRLLKRWARPPKDKPGYGPDGLWCHPTGFLWHTTIPDADNIRKAVLDGLRPFWRDDRLVCAGETRKVYAEATGRSRVVVLIARLDGLPEEDWP